MPTPAKPDTFDPEQAPAGVELRFVPFWKDRAIINPRSQFVHTNAARGEGTVDSAWRWSTAKPGSNTLPHYQIDRDGTAAKFIPSNRRGIATATVTSVNAQWATLTVAQRAEISRYGNISNWSLGYETADSGTDDDPGISAFTAAQAETIATILAYESVTHDIPLVLLDEWHGAGSATHTWPFEWPYTTLYKGKICPGTKKKAQFVDVVLPRAVEIRDAWLTPPPVAPPPEEDSMLFIARSRETNKVYVGDGVQSFEVSAAALTRIGAEMDAGRSRWRQPMVDGFPLVTTPNQIVAPVKFDLPLFALIGKPR